MKSFHTRTITGLFYVLFIIIFLFAGPLTYYILFSGFLIIGAMEFYKAYSNDTPLLWKVANIITASIIFTACFFDAAKILDIPFTVILGILMLITFITKLFVDQPDIIKQSGLQYILYIYLALPIALTNYLVFSPIEKFHYDYHLLLNLFILLWCNDTGAYISGTLLGRHPFFKKISPKKTWEGIIGGFLLTLLAAFLISKTYLRLSLTQWLIIGGLVVIFGTLGDLIESMLKRNVNIKDTGNIFPGHGGLLDRIDSYLISVVAIFIFLKFTQTI